ncbi:hypothetical protein PUW79_02655 [Microbacterium sp. NE2HP2]|uniref:hypothetical protein n=1 Tax=Microbacterium plantarum TaxID=1816425 RepID=UPI002366B49B|nr:hypothetical protein [Microbacterium plantarum]MDD7943525.1 hypothetical protein [Microbacterium plantarum]
MSTKTLGAQLAKARSNVARIGDQINAHIRAAYASATSRATVARQLGIPLHHVTGRAADMNLGPSQRADDGTIAELRERGVPAIEIAERLGVAQSTMQRRIAKIGLTASRQVSDAERQAAFAQMRNAVASASRIGERFGVSAETVTKYRRRMGLRPRPARGAR